MTPKSECLQLHNEIQTIANKQFQTIIEMNEVNMWKRNYTHHLIQASSLMLHANASFKKN